MSKPSEYRDGLTKQLSAIANITIDNIGDEVNRLTGYMDGIDITCATVAELQDEVTTIKKALQELSVKLY